MPKVWVSDTSEEVVFEGREVEVVEVLEPPPWLTGSNDQFSMTCKLYKYPDGYRVHEILWALSPGQEDSYALYPPVADLGYGTYTEEEAQEKWGNFFTTCRSPHQKYEASRWCPWGSGPS